MDITTVLILSSATVMAALLTLGRAVGLVTLVRHSTIVDVSFTILMFFFTAGTAIGTMNAIISGLTMAVVLTVLKKAWPTLYRLGWVKEPLKVAKVPKPTKSNAPTNIIRNVFTRSAA